MSNAYQFAEPGTLLFVTGVPLSGKSTLSAPLAAAIEGCSLQNMDILRVLAQKMDSYKPKADREPALQYGSCDSYIAVGDGSYSKASLLEGYRRYSRAVFNLAEAVIPKLEAQGAQSVLFEGVQIQPDLTAPHLAGNNRLIIITANEARLAANRKILFGDDPLMNSRYSIKRLLLLQNEILRQSRALPADVVLHIDNSGDRRDAVQAVMAQLQEQHVIIPSSKATRQTFRERKFFSFNGLWPRVHP